MQSRSPHHKKPGAAPRPDGGWGSVPGFLVRVGRYSSGPPVPVPPGGAEPSENTVEAFPVLRPGLVKSSGPVAFGRLATLPEVRCTEYRVRQSCRTRFFFPAFRSLPGQGGPPLSRSPSCRKHFAAQAGGWPERNSAMTTQCRPAMPSGPRHLRAACPALGCLECLKQQSKVAGLSAFRALRRASCSGVEVAIQKHISLAPGTPGQT